MATAKEIAAKKAEDRKKIEQDALELANATGVHVDEEILEQMEVAVFIGWNGEFPGERVFMPGIHNCWIPVDTDGKIISPLDAAGNYVDPTTDKKFAGRRVHELEVGGVVFFPNKATNATAFGNAVRSQQFAKLKYLPTIQSLYKQGFTGLEVKNIIEQAGGLIVDTDPVPVPGADGAVEEDGKEKKSSSSKSASASSTTNSKKTTTTNGNGTVRSGG